MQLEIKEQLEQDKLAKLNYLNLKELIKKLIENNSIIKRILISKGINEIWINIFDNTNNWITGYHDSDKKIYIPLKELINWTELCKIGLKCFMDLLIKEDDQHAISLFDFTNMCIEQVIDYQYNPTLSLELDEPIFVTTKKENIQFIDKPKQYLDNKTEPNESDNQEVITLNDAKNIDLTNTKLIGFSIDGSEFINCNGWKEFLQHVYNDLNQKYHDDFINKLQQIKDNLKLQKFSDPKPNNYYKKMRIGNSNFCIDSNLSANGKVDKIVKALKLYPEIDLSKSYFKIEK